MNRVSLAIVVLCVQPAGMVFAQELYVRVADVGAGLCCVVVTPDQHYMVYDAGNYEDNGNTAFAAIQEIIPPGSAIDLLVLSHCDADHLAATKAICAEYEVERVIRDGLERPTQTWQEMNNAIAAEVASDDCEDLNLKHVDLAFGTPFDIGDSAVATFVCGFYELPDHWPTLDDSEARNARSIVVRLEYGGRSILFCGDAVGRHRGDSASVSIAEERDMVDNAGNVPIDSDVIVAPHHGADNGSSLLFIQAVSPEYVIFSAGSKHNHARAATAERYASIGVDITKMFRTDLGDNEGGEEWDSTPGAGADPKGDDDVEITIADGVIDVRYRQLFFAPAPAPFAPFAAPAPHAFELAPAVAIRPCTYERRGFFHRWRIRRGFRH